MSKENSIEDLIQDVFEDVKDAIFGNERQGDLIQLAQKKGFRYRRKVRYSQFDFDLKAFDLFKTRKKKRIRNILTKKEESLQGEVWLFDCHLDGNLGKKATTVIHLKSSALSLPKILIRPKRTTEKLTSLFVHQDIILDRYPEFKRNFTLKADDLDAASFLITPKLARLLVEHPNAWVEGQGQNLLIYRQNESIPSTKLVRFLDFALELGSILLYDRSNEFV